MTHPVNIHAKIFLITTKDFKAVVSYGAENFAESTMGAFVLACESLEIDPDDYPVPNQDWSAQLVGAPVTTYMRDEVILASLM